MVRTNRALVVLSLVLGTSWGAPAVVLADLFTFNAGLNTTPQEQGWALEVQGTQSPYEVGGGTLMQMATFDNSVTTWNVKANAFDFSSSTPTVVDALMLVKKSDYVVLDGAWRSGYAFTMTDVHDRHFVLGIATTGVRLTNDLSWLETSSSPFLNLDTRTVYAYQLVAHDDMVELFIDGEKKLELGVGAPRSVPNRTNTVRFGDASLLASSATTVGYVNVFAVPEPGSWLLFAGGLVLGLGYWRRRRHGK